MGDPRAGEPRAPAEALVGEPRAGEPRAAAEALAGEPRPLPPEGDAGPPRGLDVEPDDLTESRCECLEVDMVPKVPSVTADTPSSVVYSTSMCNFVNLVQ